MACLKCGSEWVTLKGKDMVSCPECCKQQRCKARKQGRLPAEEEKACERCGVRFTAKGGNAITRSRQCSACAAITKRECQQARKKKLKAGEWKPKPKRNRKGRKCLRCGSQLNKNQIKYCGSECYNAAKKEGIQSWDRTGQLESIWHRGGRWACAPSRKPIQEMRTNMQAFLCKVQRLCRAAAKKAEPCRHCGNQCRPSRKGFCSPKCFAVYREMLPCSRCKSLTPSMWKRRQLCPACLDIANREKKRQHKRLYGRNHRSRARHHGVQYQSVPVKQIYERDNYTCQICLKKCLPKAMLSKQTGKIHPMSPTIDHIVPMCRGGDHVEANLQTACFRCNTAKGSKGGGQLRLAIL
jgi:hypothetical protein